MDLEQTYTSTGAKFWRHRQAMYNYRAGDPHTIISTHISPTSACNLNCRYCSVRKRSRNNHIPLSTIKAYILTLMRYGLKAVILTGGGEPTLYEHINELIGFIEGTCNLQLALITNGTACDRVRPDRWAAFSWVRVSLNEAALDRINLPTAYLVPECTVGCSAIYSGTQADPAFLRACRDAATSINASYVRLLPDCLQTGDELMAAHENIGVAFAELNDDRFFHQRKMHRRPRTNRCHQARFRPYLSEEPFHGNGEPGAVYPCDSLVLNDRAARFTEQFQLCHALDVEQWLNARNDGIDPARDCDGCVFAGTINMLDDWANGKIDKFDQHREPIDHANFV